MKKTTEEFTTDAIKDQQNYYLLPEMHKLKKVKIGGKLVEFEVFFSLKEAPDKMVKDGIKITIENE